MGLQSALSTALTGMNAAETTIDVVGNNVANSQTVGFKASEAVFATQFLQTQSLGSSPTGTRGGTNPRQIGLGTKVAEITPDFTQGTIEVSSNPLDLAIQGDGFLIVQGSQGGENYTRNGQLKTNAENELVTITGQRLMGYGIDSEYNIKSSGILEPITIPLGASPVTQETSNVFLTGTLPPPNNTNAVATQGNVIRSGVLSDGIYEVPATSATAAVVTEPTVGTTLASAGAGTVTPEDYTYRVTFVGPSGAESPPSAVIGPHSIAGPGNEDINLSSIPTPPTGSPWTGRNIYRADSGGTYQLVTTINNTTATTYTDSTDTGSLGATLDAETLDIGSYSYYVTFYDSVGGQLESRPAPLIGPVAVGQAGRRILLDNIPQPATGDFDSVRIYRNLSGSPNDFYRIDTIPTGQTTYVDGLADANVTSTPANEINLDGPPIQEGTTLLTDVVSRNGANYNNIFELGTLSFDPSKGQKSLAPQELLITATTTIQDLKIFMEEAAGIQRPDTTNGIPGNAGGTVNADGTIQFESNYGEGNALSFDPSDFQLTDVNGVVQSVDLPFSEIQAATGASTTTEFVAYDSLGSPLNVNITAVLESADSTETVYRWYADSVDNDPAAGAGISVGTGLIRFNQQGAFTTASNSTILVDRDNVSAQSPLSFDLDFSELSGLDATAGELNVARTDGFPPGTLTSFIVSESGTIRGVFTNGATRDLGQIRMARFANNAGLEQIGDNMYAEGVNSGEPLYGNPGGQGIGTITAGAVELSNTDIGQNLIELILASTQYRGGTRVITAAQELLDELLALRR